MLKQADVSPNRKQVHKHFLWRMKMRVKFYLLFEFSVSTEPAMVFFPQFLD